MTYQWILTWIAQWMPQTEQVTLPEHMGSWGFVGSLVFVELFMGHCVTVFFFYWTSVTDSYLKNVMYLGH